MIWQKVRHCSLLILLPALVIAQELPTPRPSPLAIATARYKDTYVKIIYGQPHKNGRPIFGALVPFGEVWRTGANEATEITVTHDLQINGIQLKAGTYSLFTIPGLDRWTIIINSEPGLWGSYNYNPKLDVFRFDVQPEKISDGIYEAFTIRVDQKNDKAVISLLWDNVKVSFPMQFQEPKP